MRDIRVLDTWPFDMICWEVSVEFVASDFELLNDGLDPK